MTACRSCGAEVVFVPSAKSGKPMILDATPAKGIVIVKGGLPLRDVARVVDVFTDHHATCPKAAEWKGRTR